MTGGIPASTVELTTVVGFNDLEALERAFATHPGQVAGVIVEPAMMNIGFVLPEPGYLAGVVEIAHRHGAVVIFDEVKTGVTIAPGGATERFGVVPDIVCLAKAIGGGLPCGAVGGRADIMATISDGKVAQLGTFNGNPLTTAASRATLTRGPHRPGVFASRRAHRGAEWRPSRGDGRVRTPLPRGVDGSARVRHLSRASRCATTATTRRWTSRSRTSPGSIRRIAAC